MARSLLVHARLPDSFMYHALVYACHIFNVLPVKGLYSGDHVATPYELFHGTQPTFESLGVQLLPANGPPILIVMESKLNMA
jgi:hypothetical protein